MEQIPWTRIIVTIRHPLFERPFARWCIVVSTAAITGAWIAILAIPAIPGDIGIVTHYTTTFGIDALGRWTELIWLPIVGTISVVANVTIAWFALRPPPRLRARVTQWSSTIADVVPMLLSATVLITFLVLIGSLLLLRVNMR